MLRRYTGTLSGGHVVFGETRDHHKYDSLTCEAAVIGWILDEEESTNPPLHTDQAAGLVLDKTCFYAEQGGQVGDSGIIETESGVFNVETTLVYDKMVVHWGTVQSGEISSTQRAVCKVASARGATMQNHTATHILNWALREVLGAQVQQKGSLVDPEKTRFDFSHNKQPSLEELIRVEDLCNEYIKANRPLNVQEEVEKDKALQINTLRAVFGEQYPEHVRVISIGPDIDAMVKDPTSDEWMKYSVEFCGGTHCKSSGEVERFVLISEEGVAKGIRRVVGISGEAARTAEADGAALLDELKSLAGAPPDKLADQISAFQQKATDTVIPIRVRHELRERITELQKKVKKQEKAAASDAAGEVMGCVAKLFAEADTVGGVTVVVSEVPAAPADALRGAIDWVRNKTDASAVLLVCAADDKVTLVAGMSKAVVAKGPRAGDLIKEIAPLVGGRGGGRPDMAQGGGNDPAGIANAVERAKSWIAEKLT